ncbi:hypothetical protein [Streptomyces sp. NPDC001135]
MRDHAHAAEPEGGVRHGTPPSPTPQRRLPHPWPNPADGHRHDEGGGETPAPEQRTEPEAGTTAGPAATAAHVTVLTAERGIINTGTVHGGQYLTNVDVSGRPVREADRGA